MVKELRKKMTAAAKEMAFEQAAVYRDEIRALEQKELEVR